MIDTALQSTKRELHRAFTQPRAWAAIVGVALVIGVVGPFGTYEKHALLPRVAYWFAIAVLTYGVGLATVHFVIAAIHGARRPGWIAYGLAGLAAGLPVAAVVLAINALLYGPEPPVETLALILSCMVIAGVGSALIALYSMPSRPDGPPAESAAVASPAPVPPPLLARLPLHLRGDLAYLSMQDHYVDVHTARGSTLLLMRFADAVGETGPTEGLQIHRSYWIARQAVVESVRRDGRLFLRMADGAELPVSRPYLAAVRSAGLA